MPYKFANAFAFGSHSGIQFDILHLTSAHTSRDSRIFQRECVTLAQSGYRVGLIAPNGADENISGVQILGVSKPKRKTMRLAMTPFVILRGALRHPAEVYHFHDPELLPIGLMLRLLHKKVVYDAHEDHPSSILHSPSIPRQLRGLCSKIFKSLEGIAANHWSAVISANDEITNKLSDLGCDATTVGNFPDLSNFPVPATQTSRYSSGIIANFGGIEPRTCIIPIVKALALLPNEVPARMLLGGKNLSPALYEEAVALPGWERVDFQGVQPAEAMVHQLLDASIALILYKREPNNYGVGSNRFYEALAAGLPVITSNFPNWKQIVERFDCGLTVDPEDPQAIAAALKYLLTHPEEARRMGENSRRAGLHHCNWSRERTKLLQLYGQLLPAHPVSSALPEASSMRQVTAHSAAEGGSEMRYLTPDEFAEWDALVDSSLQGSIFCRSWWLQALRSDVRVLGYFESGQLVAGIPLYFKKRYGMQLCTMPRLTQTWGLVLRPLSGKTVSTSSHEMRISKIFSQHLAQERFFLQVFHPTFKTWLPFHWGGFKQTLGCTYLIDDLSDCDALWQGMGHNVRTKIRKAQKEGLTVHPCSIDVVFDCVRKSFDRQQKSEPYSREYLTRLYEAARENQAGECFACSDDKNVVYAASFVVWDNKAAYYLAGGADPQLRNSGAQSLVAWHTIQFAATRTKSFDFCGSVIESIEQFVRSFGAKQIPYSRITKMPATLRLLSSSAF